MCVGCSYYAEQNLPSKTTDAHRTRLAEIAAAQREEAEALAKEREQRRRDEYEAAQRDKYAAMEKARKREKDLQTELATARGAVETAAASTLQRVFNKRWTRVLQERYHTAHAQAEAAEAEHARLKDELEESQRALIARRSLSQL